VSFVQAKLLIVRAKIKKSVRAWSCYYARRRTDLKLLLVPSNK